MDKWPNREQLIRAVLLGADGIERLDDIPEPAPGIGEVVDRPFGQSTLDPAELRK